MKKYKIFYIGMCTGNNGFTRALRENAADYRELNCGDPLVNIEAVKIACEFQPDIIFLQIQAPNIIADATLNVFRELGSWVCNFTGDVRQPLPQWYISTGRLIDMTFFTNEADVDVCHRNGIDAAYLNIGFDPAIYYPEDDVHIPTWFHDIVFMANNYPWQFPLSGLRMEIAKRMKAAFGDRFGIFGTGWVMADGNHMQDQRMEASSYHVCKIAINCSHFDLERYSSDRILRIMGSGAFCLSKWFPGYEKDYKDGEHLVIWHSIDDLIAKCEHYLANESERKRIAAAGCLLVHSRDTFDHMVKNMLSFYEQ